MSKCRAIYRKWLNGAFAYYDGGFACPYSGTAYINASGYAVEAEDDRCGKTINDCKARFGAEALPFMGYPSRVGVMGQIGDFD